MLNIFDVVILYQLALTFWYPQGKLKNKLELMLTPIQPGHFCFCLCAASPQVGRSAPGRKRIKMAAVLSQKIIQKPTAVC